MSKSSIISEQADINTAASGDTTLITARGDRRIYVWKLWLQAHGAVNIKFKSGSNELNAAPVHLLADGSDITFPYDSEPYWVCNRGEDFKINLSGAVQVTGRVYYGYGA